MMSNVQLEVGLEISCASAYKNFQESYSHVHTLILDLRNVHEWN